MTTTSRRFLFVEHTHRWLVASLALLAFLPSCTVQPEVKEAVDHTAEMDQARVDNAVEIGHTLRKLLDEEMWQRTESEHETRLRAKAAEDAATERLSVDDVLELRDEYSGYHDTREQRIRRYGEQLDEVQGDTGSAELRAELHRLLDKLNDRSTAARGATKAVAGAAPVVADAMAARRERKRLEAQAKKDEEAKKEGEAEPAEGEGK